MDVSWLTPAAWWGSATLAIPIAIHLLTRQTTRRLPFPTLRFLQSTRLAAFRRRSIHDWRLLIVRASILLAAVAALAGPVIVSSERRSEWQRRVARALVVAPQSNTTPEQDNLIAGESRTSFSSAVFRPSEHLADGLRDASAWLEREPPAAREIVIIGDLKEGAISELDLPTPAAVGVRFLPTPVVGDVSTITIPLGRATAASVTLLDNSTRVTYSEQRASNEAPITVRAAAPDAGFADAALKAVLSRGIRLDRSGTRRVVVVFEGGDARDLHLQRPAAAPWMRDALSALAGMTGGHSGDVLVVMTHRRANDPSAMHDIDRVARAAFAEDLSALEPRRIPAATLAAWSRPPGLVDGAPTVDEGDRRWFWGAALLLLVVEWFLRRRPPTAATAAQIEERQVA